MISSFVGIKPTDCQAQQVSSQGSMMRGPECNPDGKYEEVQCKTLTKECWCVDASGLELTGSRTTKYLRCPQAGMYKKKNKQNKE